jgi:cytochrome P450
MAGKSSLKGRLMVISAYEPPQPASDDTLTLHGGESRVEASIRNNPFPFYRALRREHPIYYDAKIDAYLITRYEDAVQVLRDDETFSLEHGYQDRWANGHVDELAEIMNRDGGGFVRDIIACDPPRHTRLRQLLDRAFTAHRVKTLEPRVRQIVIDLIEPLAERGHGDGMKDIGAPMTARIICEQLGLDFECIGAEKIAAWTTALLAQAGRMQTREEMIANAALICEMQNVIIPEIRARESEPREDMISDLVHARVPGDANARLTFEEQVSSVRALLIAGNDTTAAALANLMLLLATQKGLTDELYQIADDDRLLNRFVEEVLRIEPPAHGLFRTAMKDIELSGTLIPAHSQVCIMFASANDDEDEFADSRKIDLARPNATRHLTFGAGTHRCIGAALSRMEVKIAAQEIIRRLDHIELAIAPEAITYQPNVAMQTIERLPLTFTRRKPSA